MPQDENGEPGPPEQRDRGQCERSIERTRVLRPRKERPWCWQEKAALRQIREGFDQDNTVASGIAVYVAMTEIASDHQSDEFDATHAYIGLKAGVSKGTAEDRVNDLAEIRLVQIFKAKGVKKPSTYRLLPVEQPLPNVEQPLLNDAQPLPNVEQRMQNPPLLSLEESLEESSEESGEGGAAPLPPDRDDDYEIVEPPPTLEQVKRELRQEGIECSDTEVHIFFYDHCELDGISGSVVQTWRQWQAKGPSKIEQDALEVYDEYPRKVGRPAALRAIKRALARHSKSKLLEAVRAFAQVWQGADANEKRFCPHPTTWFNEERFNDDPSTWQLNRAEKGNQNAKHSHPQRGEDTRDHTAGF